MNKKLCCPIYYLSFSSPHQNIGFPTEKKVRIISTGSYFEIEIWYPDSEFWK